MSKEAPWIRLAVDTLDSPMFSDAGDSVALCWVCLLCWAKMNGRGGRFTLNRRAFRQRWGRFDDETIAATITNAVKDGAIECEGDSILIVNWTQYQDNRKFYAGVKDLTPPTQPPNPSADRTPSGRSAPVAPTATGGQGGGVMVSGGGVGWGVGGSAVSLKCCKSTPNEASAAAVSQSNALRLVREPADQPSRPLDGPPSRPKVEGLSGVGHDSDASGAIVGQSGNGSVLAALTRAGVLSDHHRAAAAKLDGITPEEVASTAASIRAEGAARNSGAVLLHRLFAKRGLKPPRSKGMALAAASPADRAVNERMQQLRDNRNRGASEGGRK